MKAEFSQTRTILDHEIVNYYGEVGSVEHNPDLGRRYDYSLTSTAVRNIKMHERQCSYSYKTNSGQRVVEDDIYYVRKYDCVYLFMLTTGNTYNYGGDEIAFDSGIPDINEVYPPHTKFSNVENSLITPKGLFYLAGYGEKDNPIKQLNLMAFFLTTNLDIPVKIKMFVDKNGNYDEKLEIVNNNLINIRRLNPTLNFIGNSGVGWHTLAGSYALLSFPHFAYSDPKSKNLIIEKQNAEVLTFEDIYEFFNELYELQNNNEEVDEENDNVEDLANKNIEVELTSEQLTYLFSNILSNGKVISTSRILSNGRIGFLPNFINDPQKILLYESFGYVSFVQISDWIINNILPAYLYDMQPDFKLICSFDGDGLPNSFEFVVQPRQTLAVISKEFKRQHPSIKIYNEAESKDAAYEMYTNATLEKDCAGISPIATAFGDNYDHSNYYGYIYKEHIYTKSISVDEMFEYEVDPEDGSIKFNIDDICLFEAPDIPGYVFKGWYTIDLNYQFGPTNESNDRAKECTVPCIFKYAKCSIDKVKELGDTLCNSPNYSSEVWTTSQTNDPKKFYPMKHLFNDGKSLGTLFYRYFFNSSRGINRNSEQWSVGPYKRDVPIRCEDHNLYWSYNIEADCYKYNLLMAKYAKLVTITFAIDIDSSYGQFDTTELIVPANGDVLQYNEPTTLSDGSTIRYSAYKIVEANPDTHRAVASPFPSINTKVENYPNANFTFVGWKHGDGQKISSSYKFAGSTTVFPYFSKQLFIIKKPGIRECYYYYNYGESFVDSLFNTYDATTIFSGYGQKFKKIDETTVNGQVGYKLTMTNEEYPNLMIIGNGKQFYDGDAYAGVRTSEYTIPASEIAEMEPVSGDIYRVTRRYIEYGEQRLMVEYLYYDSTIEKFYTTGLIRVDGTLIFDKTKDRLYPYFFTEYRSNSNLGIANSAIDVMTIARNCLYIGHDSYTKSVLDNNSIYVYANIPVFIISNDITAIVSTIKVNGSIVSTNIFLNDSSRNIDWSTAVQVVANGALSYLSNKKLSLINIAVPVGSTLELYATTTRQGYEANITQQNPLVIDFTDTFFNVIADGAETKDQKIDNKIQAMTVWVYSKIVGYLPESAYEVSFNSRFLFSGYYSKFAQQNRDSNITMPLTTRSFVPFCQVACRDTIQITNASTTDVKATTDVTSYSINVSDMLSCTVAFDATTTLPTDNTYEACSISAALSNGDIYVTDNTGKVEFPTNGASSVSLTFVASPAASSTAVNMVTITNVYVGDADVYNNTSIPSSAYAMYLNGKEGNSKTVRWFGTDESIGETYGEYQDMPVPTAENKLFVTWKEYGASTKFDESTSFSRRNIVLQAEWLQQDPVVEVFVLVKLNPNGGLFAEPRQAWKTVQCFEAYGDLPTPTREGYTFYCWSTDSNDATKKVQSDTIVQTTKDHELFALWSNYNPETPSPDEPVTTYRITFNPVGGHLATEYLDVLGTFNANVLPTPTTGSNAALAGKLFAGWFYSMDKDDAFEVVDGKITIESDVTMYAHWKEQSVTISFDLVDPYLQYLYYISPISTILGRSLKLSSIKLPLKSNHTFNGWRIGAEDGELATDSTTFNLSTTLYADWQYVQEMNSVKYFKITKEFELELNGGSLSQSYGELKYVVGQEKLLPTAQQITKAGKTFGGWFETNDFISGFEYSAITAIDVTERRSKLKFYAKWLDEQEQQES